MEFNDRNANFIFLLITMIYYGTYYFFTDRLTPELIYRLLYRTINAFSFLYYDYATAYYVSTCLWIISWYFFINYGLSL